MLDERILYLLLKFCPDTKAVKVILLILSFLLSVTLKSSYMEEELTTNYQENINEEKARDREISDTNEEEAKNEQFDNMSDDTSSEDKGSLDKQRKSDSCLISYNGEIVGNSNCPINKKFDFEPEENIADIVKVLHQGENIKVSLANGNKVCGEVISSYKGLLILKNEDVFHYINGKYIVCFT